MDAALQKYKQLLDIPRLCELWAIPEELAEQFVEDQKLKPPDYTGSGLKGLQSWVCHFSSINYISFLHPKQQNDWTIMN